MIKDALNLPHCKDCGKLLSHRKYSLCRSCSLSGKKSRFYIDGRTLQKHYCKDCGKLLAKSSYKSIYCQRCTQLSNKNHNYKNGKPYCKDCGKPLTNYGSIYCQSCRQLGEKNVLWKGGITPLHLAIRALSEYKQWHDNIFIRDNYTCQECGLHSGYGKTIYLEVHHSEKSFLELLQEFLQEYDQFSPYEDQHTLLRLATKWQPFWDAKGETLCKKCHNLTKKGNLSKQKGNNGS